MPCAICETRRPKRYCPGVRGEICTICCGTEREVTVSCPLDCVYLQQARRHEKLEHVDPEHLPDRDIRVSDELMHANTDLVFFLARVFLTSALETHGAVDRDLREALESLVRSYRALQNGVYYESVPTNPLAAAIFRRVQDELAAFRSDEPKRLGISKTRDADVLGVLVFLERLGLANNNGRPRGRVFFDVLHSFERGQPDLEAPLSSPLILP